MATQNRFIREAKTRWWDEDAKNRNLPGKERSCRFSAVRWKLPSAERGRRRRRSAWRSSTTSARRPTRGRRTTATGGSGRLGSAESGSFPAPVAAPDRASEMSSTPSLRHRNRTGHPPEQYNIPINWRDKHYSYHSFNGGYSLTTDDPQPV